MEYRIDYQDDDAPITVLPQPSRAVAIRQARKLSAGCDRTVYVIGHASGVDVGQIIYMRGAQADSDGDRI